MVDLYQRPMAPAEIRRFADRFGLAALLDTEGKSYVDAGLKYLRMSNADILSHIEQEPQLLRLPLVRAGNPAGTKKRGRLWPTRWSGKRNRLIESIPGDAPTIPVDAG